MAGEGKLRKKNGKPSLRYQALDRRVKNYLEQVWLERARWITRRTAERKAALEAQAEERRRKNGLMDWLRSPDSGLHHQHPSGPTEE